MSILGETLDIHTGGVDLQFPHHEDEIAQSEGATGKPFSRFWCHGEFLLTDGAKMAKRVGNVQSVQDLRDQDVRAAAVRHFMFSTHYRKQLNLSGVALEASVEAVRRVGDFAARLESAFSGTPALGEAAREFRREFDAALHEDLNAPRAQAAMFVFINQANAELDKRGNDEASLAEAREAFGRANGVLDIIPDRRDVDAALSGWVEGQIAARKAARGVRDFAAADAIRKALEEKGIVVEDTPPGRALEEAALAPRSRPSKANNLALGQFGLSVGVRNGHLWHESCQKPHDSALAGIRYRPYYRRMIQTPLFASRHSAIGGPSMQFRPRERFLDTGIWRWRRDTSGGRVAGTPILKLARWI